MSWISRTWKNLTGGQDASTDDAKEDGGSSLLDVVFGLGSSYLDYASNLRNSRKAATKAYERNLASAMYQNDYNSPVKAMQRLRDAGLNPNLIYGSVDNSAASISSAPVANSPSRLELVSAYLDLRQKDAMTQLVRAQTKALDLENNENEDNGTSRTTPYPVKLGKAVVSSASKASSVLAKPIANSLNSFSYRNLPSSYNRLVDGVINKIMGKDFDYGTFGDYQKLKRR